jgi:hypothetical protein
MGDNLTSFSLHILLAFLDLLISLVCLLMMSDYFLVASDCNFSGCGKANVNYLFWIWLPRT